jgi:hypothetical protein
VMGEGRAFLRKPFAPDVLVKKVREMVEQSQAALAAQD